MMIVLDESQKARCRTLDAWMVHHLLPENLRERIMFYKQYKWLETRGVDGDNLIHILLKDLRKDIKSHLCLTLLMRVPMFERMDEQLIYAMCVRLNPVLPGLLIPSISTLFNLPAWFNDEQNSIGDLCAGLSNEAAMVKSLVTDRVSLLVQTISAVVLAVIMGLVVSGSLQLL